ncbi:MAG: Wzz/FepE/Etk N-terminal domain-containing protein, partial [Candidatus Gastranaerophilales bacterium]|nr:Wzz/FepE/Etk N-terminal domain-containing protein [Candidatus Gastranaerophilales bacterium]
MENLTLEKIFQLIRKNINLISVFALTGLVVGILYSLIVFKPLYKSTSRLLIKDAMPTTFISELNMVSPVSTLMKNANPTLTQMEIILSESLARKVWEQISEKYKFKNSESVGIKLMQDAISINNPVGTDILEITATWKTPQIAQDIAKFYEQEYINLNIENAKKSIGQSKNSINKEFDEAQINLQVTREQIKNFRQSFSTVNIMMESENIVTQLAELENRYSEVASDAAAAADRRNSIAKNLGIEWDDAISSVAIGHNDNFNTLQRRLGESQEELAVLSTKYASTHPAMIALDARIANIKEKLAEQIKLTIGNKEGVNPIIISDPVRTGMLEELSANEAEYRGLVAQSNILNNVINNLQRRRAEIPKKQLALANLTQEEANWTNVVNALKAKQIEAQIKESEIISNIGIIDSPSLAKFAAFPTRSHVALMFGLLGALLGIFGTIIEYLIKNVYDSAEEISEELKVPLLGAIPWIERESYYEPETSLAIDDVSSFYSLAYQKTIANIGLKGFQNNVKTLMFTSTEYSKTRSTILMNTAIGLSKAGYSVAIIDADFRTPSIHQEFKISNDTSLYSLSRLLKIITS